MSRKGAQRFCANHTRKNKDLKRASESEGSLRALELGFAQECYSQLLQRTMQSAYFANLADAKTQKDANRFTGGVFFSSKRLA
jgi:hypothetical protein